MDTITKNLYQKYCMSIPPQTHGIVVAWDDLVNEALKLDRRTIDESQKNIYI